MVRNSEQYKYFQKALEHIMEGRETGARKALAGATHQAAATITNLIKGKRGASYEKMIKVANALDFDIIDFLQLGRSLLLGDKPAEKPAPKHDKTSETLVKAAEAFCEVLIMEKERSDKEDPKPGSSPGTGQGVAVRIGQKKTAT